jgi:hypothetical protein
LCPRRCLWPQGDDPDEPEPNEEDLGSDEDYEGERRRTGGGGGGRGARPPQHQQQMGGWGTGHYGDGMYAGYGGGNGGAENRKRKAPAMREEVQPVEKKRKARDPATVGRGEGLGG